MFTPTRETVRRFFVDAWSKRKQGAPVSALEIIAADIIVLHPEVQPLLSGTDAIERNWPTTDGNPFLHLSLHLALAEQLQIDQPAGICAVLEALTRQLGERHAALHTALEALNETLWQAQQTSAPPDGAAYLARIRRHLR